MCQRDLHDFPAMASEMAILTRPFTPFFSLVVYFIIIIKIVIKRHQSALINHACGLSPPVLIIL